MTLGHNSSVIFYDGINKPLGFEEERLTGKKSDSSFPKNAIEKIIEFVGNELEGATVYISHWFDTFDIESFPDKYYNHKAMDELCRVFSLKIVTLNSNFTHHDAHAYSSKAFVENFQRVSKDTLFIVADGFGNNKEVLSFYKPNTSGLELIDRVYGFKNSLGLLYQYATSYCGMKENQDEYKFLGYESNILNVLTEKSQLDVVNKHVEIYKDNFISKFIYNFLNAKIVTSTNNSYLDIEDLMETKKYIHEFIDMVLNAVKAVSQANRIEYIINESSTRTIVGYFIQACLEKCIVAIITYYNYENVVLSGGCFMNVKLNKKVLDTVRGTISVNPLCGDQGAAIGLYHYTTGCSFDYADLCFGRRKHSYSELVRLRSIVITNPNVIQTTEHDFVEVVSKLIKDDFIVNIVRNDMEFGPRALCNTSTLAIPSKENVKYINMINNRNEVMPMAPVTTADLAEMFMKSEDLERVIGSNKFMIITHDFDSEVLLSGHSGVVHNKPLDGGYTCRPQILDENDYEMNQIVINSPMLCLINTSFNTHGNPILYSLTQILYDFQNQYKLDYDNRVKLVIQL